MLYQNISGQVDPVRGRKPYVVQLRSWNVADAACYVPNVSITRWQEYKYIYRSH